MLKIFCWAFILARILQLVNTDYNKIHFISLLIITEKSIDVSTSRFEHSFYVVFLMIFYCFFLPFSPPLTPLWIMRLLSPLRKSASHVSLVTTVMLRDWQCLRGNAGKVSSVWRVPIAPTLLWETAEVDRVQKVMLWLTTVSEIWEKDIWIVYRKGVQKTGLENHHESCKK